MCQDALHPFLAALPKCEHHMHLEGALEPELLFKLAKKNTITLPQDDEAFASPEALLARFRRFTSLDDFLHYYFIGMSTLIEESDFEALAWDYFGHAKRDGVVHAELFFDPQAHIPRGVAYETVVNGFLAACERAEKELGITNELIVCFLRHLPASDAEGLYQIALPDIKSGKIKGIGLSSSEKGNPPGLFKNIYGDARQQGIFRTAHAGEEAGVDYMKEALVECHVQRMDHGIKLTEDPEFLKLCAEKKIMVTMCPMSNKELRCVKDIKELPVRKYLDAGVTFSINSDDPAYFGGYILDNYCAVQTAFSLSKKEWKGIVEKYVDQSQCSSSRKAEIVSLLQDVYAQYS